MFIQNLPVQNNFYRIFYQPFDFSKSNFRSFMRESLTHQMLITQLQKALQEPHSIISDLAGKRLILSEVFSTTEQTIGMESVNYEILP